MTVTWGAEAWAEQLQRTRLALAAALDHYADLLDGSDSEGIALDRALGRLEPHFADIKSLFPDPDALAHAARLKVIEEWTELLIETYSMQPDNDALGTEVADLIVALIVWARTLGISVGHHLEEKSRVVADRPIERRGETWHHVARASVHAAS